MTVRSEKYRQGSVREVLHLSWPLVISMLSYTAMGVTDTLFVGWIGKTELGAIGGRIRAGHQKRISYHVVAGNSLLVTRPAKVRLHFETKERSAELTLARALLRECSRYSI